MSKQSLFDVIRNANVESVDGRRIKDVKRKEHEEEIKKPDTGCVRL